MLSLLISHSKTLFIFKSHKNSTWSLWKFQRHKWQPQLHPPRGPRLEFVLSSSSSSLFFSLTNHLVPLFQIWKNPKVHAGCNRRNNLKLVEIGSLVLFFITWGVSRPCPFHARLFLKKREGHACSPVRCVPYVSNTGMTGKLSCVLSWGRHSNTYIQE